MKKTMILVAMLAGAAFFAMGGSALAVVAGSVHDITAGPYSFTLGTGETVCTPCHTPHNAGGTADAPLANRDFTVSAYTYYSSTNSPTFDGGASDVTVEPSGLCLSCHDGTQALDAYGATAGTGAGANLEIGNTTGYPGANTNANLGQNLTSQHPVGFTYTGNAADSGIVGTAPTTLPLYGTGADQVSCASCHDVHNSTATVVQPLLRMATATLCQDCHIK